MKHFLINYNRETGENTISVAGPAQFLVQCLGALSMGVFSAFMTKEEVAQKLTEVNLPVEYLSLIYADAMNDIKEELLRQGRKDDAAQLVIGMERVGSIGSMGGLNLWSKN